MDARQIIEKAKDHLKTTFAGEEIFNVGLEEVEHDDKNNVWKITLGFSRPWDKEAVGALFGQTVSAQRAFKVLTIDPADGSLISIKNREEK